MHAAYPSSTPSWEHLAGCRKRGQRPRDGVILTDSEDQRRNLVNSGAYTLRLPTPEQAVYLAGLEVGMIAQRDAHSAEVAINIVAVRPSRFAIYWRREGRQLVIG